MMKKLLLADDSITIQKVVGIIFATEDFDLTMTDDGDSAFEKALELIPDLVIADISMPGKDGFELCRAIKREPRLSHTSVLLLPGAFDHFDENKAEEVCADGWLTKPFESQALLDKVNQLIATDPVLMDGVAAADSQADDEISVAAVESETLVEDSFVNESVLGLEAIGEVRPVVKLVDNSPDDIWDAVSFEEDDLLVEDDLLEIETEEPFFAAETGDFVSPEAEPEAEAVTAEESSVFAADLLIEDIAEEVDDEGDEIVFADDSEAVSGGDDSLARDVEAAAAAETSADVDFSTYADVEDTDSTSGESPEDDVSSVASSHDEVLELTGDQVEDVELDPVGFEADGVEPAGAGLSAETPFDTIDEEDSTVFGESAAVEEEPFVFSDNADEVAETSFVFEDENKDFTVTSSEPEDESSILDLSEDDIIEELTADDELEELNLLPMDDFEPGIDVDGAVAEQRESIELEEKSIDTIGQAETESEPESVEEMATEAYLPAEDLEEVDEMSPLADKSEEPFYFETDENDDSSTDAFISEAAAGAVISGSDVEEEPAGAAALSAAQVENRLRELSDEDLMAIVSRVAGPIIEKKAEEMLEQIAWDVVPDLAEAIIKEEIRKIKQAMMS